MLCQLRVFSLMMMLFFVAAYPVNGKEAYAGEPSGQKNGIRLPCGGMTIDGAAEILEAGAESVKYSYSEELNTCSYMVTFNKSIRYSVYVATDISTAKSDMASVVDGLKFLVSCESVANVGDSAMYCSGDKAERLLVQKEKVWIDIRTPKGLEAKIRVAQKVLQ